MFQLYKRKYITTENELEKYYVEGMENLVFYKNIGYFERLVSFLKKLSYLDNFYIYNPTHGGSVGLELLKDFQNLFFINTNSIQEENIKKNLKDDSQKVHFQTSETTFLEKSIAYIENLCDNDEIDCEILITKTDISLNNYTKYFWKQNTLNIYVSNSHALHFEEIFKFYMKNDNILEYDNLLHLSMIVKDAGPQFRDFLIHNLPYIDRWTILDTGSSDDTIKYINEILVGKKEGNLYEEPFVNFEVSRNRALELTGTECKFVITLDDTYYLNGPLRHYLNILRQDVVADSFSIYITDETTEYCSNRIIHSSTGLRYKGYIHEVINHHNNKNIMLNKSYGFIDDKEFNYMEERSKNRRELDLKLLYEELEKDPFNERTYYYLGATYFLLKDYENAYTYYSKRLDNIYSGYIQERYAAAMKLGNLCFFHLPNRKSETIGFYEKAGQILPNRFEPDFYKGYFYYRHNFHKQAYENFKTATSKKLDIYNSQYDCEIHIYTNELPILLSTLCFQFKDYELGTTICDFYLNSKKEDKPYYFTMSKWRNIYTNLVNFQNILPNEKIQMYEKKLLVIISFEDFLSKELFESLSDEFEIVYFGNTELFKTNPLDTLLPFLKNSYIHTVLLNDANELLPVLYKSNAENIHLLLNKTELNCNILINDFKLKSVIIDEEKVDKFLSLFNIFSNKLHSFEDDIEKIVNVDSKVITDMKKFLSSYQLEYKNFQCWRNDFQISSWMIQKVQPYNILMIGENTGTNSFHLFQTFSTIKNITVLENWKNDDKNCRYSFDKLLDRYKPKMDIIHNSNIINELFKFHIKQKEFDYIHIINDKNNFLLNVLPLLLTENGTILVNKDNINFDNYKSTPFQKVHETENFHLLQFSS